VAAPRLAACAANSSQMEVVAGSWTAGPRGGYRPMAFLRRQQRQLVDRTVGIGDDLTQQRLEIFRHAYDRLGME
jgi:hypothetical protein